MSIEPAIVDLSRSQASYTSGCSEKTRIRLGTDPCDSRAPAYSSPSVPSACSSSIVLMNAIAPPLDGRLENLGAPVRRRTVGIDDELLLAVVPRLQRRPGLDAQDAPGRHVDAFRRLAEVHRERPRHDDERLLLRVVPVPPALRARLVAPEVAAAVLGAEAVAQLRDVTRRLARLVRTRDPFELVGAHDFVAHGVTLVAERRPLLDR